MARVHLKASYGAPEIKASHLGAPTIKTTIQQMWSTSRPKYSPLECSFSPFSRSAA
jgi:disulfide oxidoreductase YuzD